LLAAKDSKCSAKDAEAGVLAMEALHKQVNYSLSCVCARVRVLSYVCGCFWMNPDTTKILDFASLSVFLVLNFSNLFVLT